MNDLERHYGSDFSAKLVAYRRIAYFGAALLGVAAVIALLFLFSGPTYFDSPLWWILVVALGAPGCWLTVRTLRTHLVLRSEAARRGVDLHLAYRCMAPPKGRTVIWTLLLLAWLVTLDLAGTPVFAVQELGSHTARTTAFHARSWLNCSRCTQHAAVQFRTEGRTFSVELRGVVQDTSYYVPGIEVVYDVDNPSVAMAEADYKQGTGATAPIAMAGSTVVFALGTWALVRIPVRQRQRRSQEGRHAYRGR
jgi:hypothetical protein